MIRMLKQNENSKLCTKANYQVRFSKPACVFYNLTLLSLLTDARNDKNHMIDWMRSVFVSSFRMVASTNFHCSSYKQTCCWLWNDVRSLGWFLHFSRNDIIQVLLLGSREMSIIELQSILHKLIIIECNTDKKVMLVIRYIHCYIEFVNTQPGFCPFSV